MKKKVEKYCMINDEKLEKDILELKSYVSILMEHIKDVKDPKKYKKMLQLKREAELMIHDLEERKLLNDKNK